MGRPSFYEQLISSGVETIYRRGFATVGVRELTATAGVAQGSFTNHFASKDDFGAAVVDRYSLQIQERLRQILHDRSRPPLARLRGYFESIFQELAKHDWRYGCLAGNMALEAAEHSELIRKRVAVYIHEVEMAFAEVLKEATQSGALLPGIKAQETAAALHEAWQGAMLRMKVDRSPAPLARFLNITFPALLQLPSGNPKKIAHDKRA